jgi:hypothetical protein
MCVQPHYSRNPHGGASCAPTFSDTTAGVVRVHARPLATFRPSPSGGISLSPNGPRPTALALALDGRRQNGRGNVAAFFRPAGLAPLHP